MGSEPSTVTEQEGPSSGVHRTAPAAARPVLASEVLRDEVAPLEPAHGVGRLWLLAVAACLALLGLGFRHGVGAPLAAQFDEGTIAFSAAGALSALGILPFPYALRAKVALVWALALMALGLRGAGPLAGLAIDGGLERDCFRLLAVTALPAALFFRSRYSSYRPARALLLGAMLLTLPFVALEMWLIAEPSAGLWSRAAATLNVAAVLCALFGFMRGDNTAGALGSGILVLIALPLELGLRQLSPLADAETGFLTYPATAVALLAVALVASLSIFQLLAAGFGPWARAATSRKKSNDGP